MANIDITNLYWLIQRLKDLLSDHDGCRIECQECGGCCIYDDVKDLVEEADDL